MQENPFLAYSKAQSAPLSRDCSSDEDNDALNEVEPVQTIEWRHESLVMGPTPQKYGRVLGLFDVSPARLQCSPSKQSPARSAKRKREEDDEMPSLLIRSPVRSRKSPQKTPNFLKRQASALSLDDATASGTPRLLFGNKPASSLSAIIRQNRQWYDADTQDDDALEALREAEGEAVALPTLQDGSSEEDVQVEAEDSSKVRWKKKGLKRSHRRVIMRPQAPKVNAPAETSSDMVQGACDPDSDEEIGEEEMAAKQHQPTMGEEVPAWLEKENLAIKEKAEARKQEQEKQQKGRKPRAASANYKSLKLRNSGAKGGSRFGRGKFGGRR